MSFDSETQNSSQIKSKSRVANHGEVFTNPREVNAILDLLPQELFTNPNTKFLDPCCKSGVFLREITKRLIEGLKTQIPDLQERIDHILKNQVFGIALTRLTSEMIRCTLYCSKKADGKYSVTKVFVAPADEQAFRGNIKLGKPKHSFVNGKCTYCGADESVYGKDDREQHAYRFIHTKTPEEIFKMKFDVIIGNPPYQMSDGGDGDSALPIYNKFIENAKKLSPNFLIMIVPSRWFAGGRGLDNFRDEMLNDKRLETIVDYPISSECFPGVEIKGGVCYFLWNRDEKGLCKVYSHSSTNKCSELSRKLSEKDSDIFIRYNEAITILNKIQAKENDSFSTFVSSRKPFGLATNFNKFQKEENEDSIKIFANKSIELVSKKEILINPNFIKKWKIYISRAYGAGEDFPHQILNVLFLGEPNSCCTETYLLIGPFDSREESENVISYIKTRFFRFLVMLRKNTQDAPKSVYQFVPLQDFSKPWTDQELYKKYNLTTEEINFIESMIRPMQ